MINVRVLVLGWLLALATALASAELSPWGPTVGSSLPHNLASEDRLGQQREFDDLVGNKGLAIAFIRSLDWCPFCQRQTIDLNQRAQDFRDAGFNIVTISYDEPAQLQAFAARFNIAIELLSDPQSEIIDAFGVRDPGPAKGSAGDGIPLPGIALVDKQGVIRATFAERSYRDRPDLDDVLATAKTL